MHIMKTLKICLITLLICLLLTLGGGVLVHTLSLEEADSASTLSLTSEAVQEVSEASSVSESLPTSEPLPLPETFPEKDITLMAVGDNLIHMGIIKTGRQKDDSYNFSFLFDNISDFLNAADIKIINQETILGGNQLGFSGFPRFNSPTEVGDAIADAGFNVVLHASNHSADKELEGLLNCTDFWKTYPEILITGIYADKQGEEENREIPLLVIDDVTFAILNYTYSTNSETIPSSIVGHINMLCSYDENNHLDFTSLNPQVLTDIARAKELADVVIVCPHWGTEYTTKPSRYQQEFAQQMTEAGADLIIGTHPHVVQPVEWIDAPNGNRALCYYSLGNYASTQKKGLTMLEAMAWITFHVSEDGVTIQPEHTGAVPMVCHYNNRVRLEKIYLLEEYTDKLAAAHGIRSYGNVNLTLEELLNWSDEILGDWVLTKEFVLSQSHCEYQ